MKRHVPSILKREYLERIRFTVTNFMGVKSPNSRRLTQVYPMSTLDETFDLKVEGGRELRTGKKDLTYFLSQTTFERVNN